MEECHRLLWKILRLASLDASMLSISRSVASINTKRETGGARELPPSLFFLLSPLFFLSRPSATTGHQQAYDARDALAKAFYGQLFNWLVATINSHINCDRKEVKASVGVLDIFGFECFEHNRFVRVSTRLPGCLASWLFCILPVCLLVYLSVFPSLCMDVHSVSRLVSVRLCVFVSLFGYSRRLLSCSAVVG